MQLVSISIAFRKCVKTKSTQEYEWYPYLVSLVLEVKVMLRIKGDSEELNSSFLNIDGRKKQITVYDLSTNDQSSPVERRAGVSAPKMFAFDAIFRRTMLKPKYALVRYQM
ncbi:kinesin-like protein KIF26B [Caerostris extrusa]|uniref:Kinesin-like protein KIF26B n=1 Tax=Caerostris extrusa TaxID=172846 RepID=A0AAV4QM01_CAEEX|nr:kinesin-like protein KIF26B [Caerostris extrusa]